jgi:uncharacterized protein YbcV (DUF1398 family)
MIYNWLNENTKNILIKMIKSRLNNNQRLKYSDVKANRMKYISFNTIDTNYTIVITDDGQIHYPSEFCEQLTGLQQQVEQYILQESRDKKLKQIINKLT